METFKVDDVLVRSIDFSSGQPASYAIGSDRETKPAVALGLGFRFPLRPEGMAVYAGAHWVVTFTESETTQHIPLRVGLAFP